VCVCVCCSVWTATESRKQVFLFFAFESVSRSDTVKTKAPTFDVTTLLFCAKTVFNCGVRVFINLLFPLISNQRINVSCIKGMGWTHHCILMSVRGLHDISKQLEAVSSVKEVSCLLSKATCAGGGFQIRAYFEIQFWSRLSYMMLSVPSLKCVVRARILLAGGAPRCIQASGAPQQK
jgi:hypothetical protein